MRKWVLLAGLSFLAFAAAAHADCWCGNGYNDASTNFVEAQVWPGDNNATTSMDFIYTTDGTDPFTSGSAQTEAGTFFQFAGSNDWYQAWLTSNNGDLVRWFARGTSADAQVCDSEEYSFTSGVSPPPVPNVVGDLESELGGGDWDNGDALTDMADPETDGIWEVTLTATADFTAGGGSGYQVVGTSGSWSPQYPGDSNIPLSFTNGEEVTFYLDTNAQPGWLPESNAVWDSKLAAGGHTWAAVGSFQGWDPASAATEMSDIGGGIYCVIVWIAAGTGYEFKCAADDGWDLQCGPNGYGSNCWTLFFDVDEDGYVGFYLDTNTGRIRIDPDATPTATENKSWGDVKSIFR